MLCMTSYEFMVLALGGDWTPSLYMPTFIHHEVRKSAIYGRVPPPCDNRKSTTHLRSRLSAIYGRVPPLLDKMKHSQSPRRSYGLKFYRLLEYMFLHTHTEKNPGRISSSSCAAVQSFGHVPYHRGDQEKACISATKCTLGMKPCTWLNGIYI
jgi:hypothetical protein